MQWQNLLWLAAAAIIAVAPTDATTLMRMSLDDLTISAGAVARVHEAAALPLSPSAAAVGRLD